MNTPFPWAQGLEINRYKKLTDIRNYEIEISLFSTETEVIDNNFVCN